MKLPLSVSALVVTPLPEGEAVAYHETLRRVYSLNRVAATVLSRCNGRTELAELVEDMRPEHGEQTEDVIWLALRRLEHCQLLSGPVSGGGLSSRREFLGKWGKAAAVLPVVASIVAPLPAAAASPPPPPPPPPPP